MRTTSLNKGDVLMRTEFIRRPEVDDLVKLSRSTIYLMIKRGEFPAPVRLGRRAVAWRVSDIENWIASRESGQDWV